MADEITEVAAGNMIAQISTRHGPRILGLVVEGTGQLLGSTEMALEGPMGTVPLIGGHRLWSAPENRTTTYVPDTRVLVSALKDGIMVVSDDSRLTIQKTISVRALDESLVVDHVLANVGARSIDVAAWAITMLKAGGTILLPWPIAGLDDEGLQAKCSVVFWPYTDLRDSRLHLSNNGAVLRVEGLGPIKIGLPNLRGWGAYLIDGVALVKWTRRFDDAARHVDLGAGIQAFVGHGFGELETLGPLTRLDPGASVRHREVWQTYRLEKGIPDFEALDSLGLAEDHPLLDSSN